MARPCVSTIREFERYQLTSIRTEINSAQLHAVGPPIADNMLVNGTMKYRGKGKYGVTRLAPGKSHRLRFINTGINNWVNLALDGHDFSVIAADLVPIVPYKTNTLSIAVGTCSPCCTYR